ncbi:hypothetical protein, partial [Escherichia coli]|uniref:hypothetical protein n=1 Tax=Escherichia coli TaxID=562 RepID=UPI00185127F2
MNDRIHLNGFELDGGGECPEQYEVYLNGQQVAYLRLRHRRFTVQCPDVGGEGVYMSNPQGDGAFDEDERD